MRAALAMVTKTVGDLGATPVQRLIPDFRSLSPRYCELVDRREALWSRLSELRAEQLAICENLSANSSPSRGTAVADHAEATRIAGLLGDPPPTVTKAGGPEARLRDLGIEMRDLDRATELLTKRIESERREVSARICDKIRPEYDKRARALIAAVIELHRVNREYTELTNALEAGDVSWQMLGPISTSLMPGHPASRNSPLSQFLYRAVEDGWLKPGDLPTELR